MLRSILSSGRRGAFVAAAILAGTTGPATAGEDDGAVRVANPASPAEPATASTPTLLWRVGGEDDEDVIFGVLTSICADENGTLYLLDQQLNQVLVFSKDGEYLRSIGHEGEGPGEFRRPSGMFLTPDGNVAVLQTMPGRIILMTRGGEPIGNHPIPEASDRGMTMFFQGDRSGDNIVLDTRSFGRTDTKMEITRSLIAIDAAGKVVTTYQTASEERDFANMSFDEKQMQSLMWACGSDGRVYVSDDFDAYRIGVYNAGGVRERVIEREYQHRKRSKEEMERNRPRIMIRRGNRTQAPEAKASETDRDILELHPRDDGTLWVVSSRGGNDAPDGTIATFDVFDADGRFARQVSIAGEGSAGDDGLHFVGDQLYVVKGLRSAQRSQMGGDDDAGEEDLGDGEPMAVLCYDLGQIVQGKK